MWQVLIGLFLIGHGLIHASWLVPSPTDDPRWAFDLDHSWLLSGIGLSRRVVKGIGTVLASLAAIGFVVTGIGVAFDVGWWPAVAVASAGISVVQLVCFYHLWLSLGMLIDAGVLLYVVGFR